VQVERAAIPVQIVAGESMARSCHCNLVVVWRGCALDLLVVEE